MASNPFFSGRIPTELYQQAEKHCQETGKGKTELLIEALSAYLNFPVALPGKSFVSHAPEVNGERIDKLEERVRFLETLLNVNGSQVIINDNIDNKSQEVKEDIVDNALENLDNNTDNEGTEDSNQDIIKNDNNTDNGKLETEAEEISLKSETLESLSKPPELPKFEGIITAEVVKKSNLTLSQVRYLTSKTVESLKQQNKIVKPGELLEEPIEAFHKEGVKVAGHSYRLFYAGENFKEKVVWNLIPDNTSYQPVFIPTNSYTITVDNNNYQNDNKKNIAQEVISPIKQEQIEQINEEQS